MEPILSLRKLSSRLGTPVARLYDIAENIDAHYELKVLEDKKIKGKYRHLRVPKAELKDIQSCIKSNVLARVPLAGEVHGGVRGRSPKSNAEKHLNRPCVVTLDVRSFFPKVRHYMVYRLLRHELGFGRDVASLLTRLTTLDAQLPQGAPTSTALANILLTVPVDGPVVSQARDTESCYTRFVDDMTISGQNPRPLINFVARMLSKRRLPMYREKGKAGAKPKLRITPRTRAQEVTGLIVNSPSGPSISRRRRDNVRAGIASLRDLDEGALPKAVNSLRGRINHVRQFNAGSAERLDRYLDKILSARRG